MTDLTREERKPSASGTAAADENTASSGATQLLSYMELYRLWERQQWEVHKVDFSRDHADWHDRIGAAEREQRLHTLSTFLVGEQLVADELAPIMRAAPRNDMRIYLCTQMADEARHAVFFRKFFEEIGELPPGSEPGTRQDVDQHLNPHFHALFDELLHPRVSRLASHPDDLEALIEVVVLYHMIIEGSLGLTSQHFTISYNEEQNTLPGLVEGFRYVAKDEHRHIAFGARFLRDMVEADECNSDAARRAFEASIPVAWEMFAPPWYEEGMEVFGVPLDAHRMYATKALTRRLKLIGLASLEELLPPC